MRRSQGNTSRGSRAGWPLEKGRRESRGWNEMSGLIQRKVKSKRASEMRVRCKLKGGSSERCRPGAGKHPERMDRRTAGTASGAAGARRRPLARTPRGAEGARRPSHGRGLPLGRMRRRRRSRPARRSDAAPRADIRSRTAGGCAPGTRPSAGSSRRRRWGWSTRGGCFRRIRGSRPWSSRWTGSDGGPPSASHTVVSLREGGGHALMTDLIFAINPSDRDKVELDDCHQDPKAGQDPEFDDAQDAADLVRLV